MQQRNTIFAGLSFAVAGAAIGAGAIVSSNAMADGDSSATANSVQVITIGANGEDPIQCTFDDVAMPAIISSTAAGVPAGGQRGVIAVTGSVDGAVPPPSGDSSTTQIVASGGLPLAGTPIEATLVTGGSTDGTDVPVLHTSGSQIAPGSPPPGLVMLSADDARPGTAEECAAIRATFDVTP
jgi:hypothetical protein